MSQNPSDQIRNTVREHYGQIAQATTTAGCQPGCCGPSPQDSLRLGYTQDDLSAVPEGANMGLGCGNPQAIAALRPGETVVDLGSGGGFDCFLAARQVGPNGRVIGVDMTAAMVSKARANAETLGVDHVDFRLGEIEHLPIADGTADVILSNCVINLSPDKGRVFQEAYRVLKPGGRLAISDVVALSPLPPALAANAAALYGCVAGAAAASEVESLLKEAGFRNIKVNIRPESREFIAEWFPGTGAENHVASATIEAVRPRIVGTSCCAPTCCDTEAAA